MTTVGDTGDATTTTTEAWVFVRALLDEVPAMDASRLESVARACVAFCGSIFG
jgi:hypothetical protein